MKARRQVGFIKTYASKTISSQEPSSKFSHFRLKQNDEEFSPYKFEEGDRPILKTTVTGSKPPLPSKDRRSQMGKMKSNDKIVQRMQAIQRSSASKIQKYSNKLQAEELLDRINQNLTHYQNRRSNSKTKLQESIAHLQTKINALDSGLKKRKGKEQNPSDNVREGRNINNKANYRFEQDSASSSSSQEQKQHTNTIPSQKIFSQRVQEASEQSEDCQPNTVTFKPREKPILQIKDYSSSSEAEDEPAQDNRPLNPQKRYEEQEFPEQKGKVLIATKDYCKNRGGICFDVDVKQFAQANPLKQQRAAQPKRAKRVDKKTQLLKRREAAKIYDKMARQALFTSYS